MKPYKEEWRDIDGYVGYYQISNNGRVKSIDRVIIRSNNKKQTFKERIIRPAKSPNGYLSVSLFKNGKGKQHTIHSLVATAFLANKNECINHIDGNKENNCVDNLEWCTYSENLYHANKLGLVKHKSRYGKDNSNAKSVVQTLNGRIVKIWDSMADAERNGFSVKSISNCCRGESNSHKGYGWRYCE